MSEIKNDFLVQRITMPRSGDSTEVKTLYYLELKKGTGLLTTENRTQMNLGNGYEVSFQTYFNALAASYWRRWSKVKTMELQVTVTGACRIQLFRSKYDGARITLNGISNTKKTGKQTLKLSVDLAPFEDGGWIWFDFTAESDCVIESAGWFVPATELTALGFSEKDLQMKNQIALGIPTFNRPDDAVASLNAIADNPQILDLVETVLMPDQGNKTVKENTGYAGAAEKLGKKLKMFKQGNLGGSGGYSRIMYESLEGTKAPFILFMDDDILIEPDSIHRALAFSKLTKQPMLVGGQMLNLQDRSHLHSMGEVVDRTIFMWTNAPYAHYDHDFAKYPLATKKKKWSVQRRVDVDFNGWWMCMIPRQIAAEIGQPLPLFIKWDDAEFGLRAGEHGYPTVTMPGVAIWHMAWSDKDDAIDWQAYFHLRNRLIVAALHHNGSHKGIMISSIKALLKHLICLEYSTVAIQIEALKDFLAGPDKLFELLPTALPKVIEMRKQYSDAIVLPSAAELPKTSGEKAILGKNEPKGKVKKVIILSKVLLNQLKPVDEKHWEIPQANYPPLEARWFSLGRVDGATVTTADGRGVVYRKRDRKLARKLLTESLKLHQQFWKEFPKLQQEYRDKLPDLVIKTSWGTIFKKEK